LLNEVLEEDDVKVYWAHVRVCRQMWLWSEVVQLIRIRTQAQTSKKTGIGSWCWTYLLELTLIYWSHYIP
jgi:hypothetical protein